MLAQSKYLPKYLLRHGHDKSKYHGRYFKLLNVIAINSTGNPDHDLAITLHELAHWLTTQEHNETFGACLCKLYDLFSVSFKTELAVEDMYWRQHDASN